MNGKEQISREEAEKRILLGLQDIWADYMKYNPDGDYLAMYIVKNQSQKYVAYGANNVYYAGDKEHPIDLNKSEEVE